VSYPAALPSFLNPNINLYIQVNTVKAKKTYDPNAKKGFSVKHLCENIIPLVGSLEEEESRDFNKMSVVMTLFPLVSLEQNAVSRGVTRDEVRIGNVA
jgi:hypothetical protein